MQQEPVAVQSIPRAQGAGLPRAWRAVLAICAVLAISFASVVSAQCANVWLPGDGVPGVAGEARAMVRWDPDGAGPQTPRLLIGGGFHVAGNVLAEALAALDPATGTWTTFGAGPDGLVYSLLGLPNGEFVVSGYFSTIGGIAANRVARWTGTGWSSMGTGLPLPADALATLANGDVVASGSFGVWRWNGTAWSVLGSAYGQFRSLCRMPNGDLIVGGSFSDISGVPAQNLARWNGVAWSAFGGGVAASSVTPRVEAQQLLANGDLVVGGRFDHVGSVAAANVARWNGSAWSPLGPGITASSSGSPVLYAIEALGNGDVVVGGVFSAAGSTSVDSLARWDGTQWSPVGTGLSEPYSGVLALVADGPTGLFTGGMFTTIGGIGARGIAHWDGVAWSAFGNGFDREIDSIVVAGDGSLVVGGGFRRAPGRDCARIARWDGAAWLPLGTGMDGTVARLLVLPNGDLVAGGSFTTAGGVVVNNIARWDGSAWSAFGTGTNGTVAALATLPNGDLVAAGYFSTAGGVAANSIARWNGTAWAPLGLGCNDLVNDLAVLPNGTLVAGGYFTQAGGASALRLAAWNGIGWSQLGGGVLGTVYTLGLMPNGDLVVAGEFHQVGSYFASGIARWNGSSWSRFGNGLMSSYGGVYALQVLPDGDLVAAGSFGASATQPLPYVARWDGAAWSAFGASVNSSVAALGLAPSGELLLGGAFDTAGGMVSVGLARLTTTCLATASPYGAACSGPGGPSVLTMRGLPWCGGSFRGRVDGVPAGALCASLFGFAATAMPLGNLHPAGWPGCDQLVVPDAIRLVLPVGSVAESELAVPDAPWVLGVHIDHQFLHLVIGATGDLLAVSSTNGLTLVVGAF